MPTKPVPQITVVVNTLNEESNLARCLSSVAGWADDLLIADMRSEDRTQAIARAYGARILEVERATHVEAARAQAIRAVAGGWILLLDADEVVPPGLRIRLRSIAETDSADAVTIPFRNYLLGHEIDFGGWEAGFDTHLRFFKADSVEWGTRIHGKPALRNHAREVSIPATHDLCMLHFSYLDVAHFVAKMNRYTDVEAAQSNTSELPSVLSLVRRCGTEFYARFVRHRGWRAGSRGFILSCLMVAYEFLIWVKIRERVLGATAEQNYELYGQIAKAAAAGARNLAGEGTT